MSERGINHIITGNHKCSKTLKWKKNTKLIDAAEYARHIGFWRAVKTITSNKQQPGRLDLQKTSDDKIAVTDPEKHEVFESLLSKKMKE